MRTPGWLLGCLVCLGAGTAAAQVAGQVDLTGTYHMKGPEGALTVILRQSGDRVTGKMVDDAGTEMLIEGIVDEDELSGTASFGQRAFEVFAELIGPDSLLWTIRVDEGAESEFVLQRAQDPGSKRASTPPGHNPLGGPRAATSPFVGDFAKADGTLRLTIRQQGQGFAGTLAVREGPGAATEYPLTLRAEGGGLAGSFGLGTDSFPMSLRLEGESSTQRLVVTSGEYVHVLDRKAGAPGSAGSTYHHPEGWFSLELPQGWRVIAQDPEALALDAGRPGAFISVLVGHLDPDEIGVAVTSLFQGALSDIDVILAEELGIWADSSGARATALSSSQHSAAEASWSGGSQSFPATIWAGTAVEGEFFVVILAVLNPEHASGLVPELRGLLGSTRVLQAPSVADLERLVAAAQGQAADPFAELEGQPRQFNRRVTVNATRLDDATIQLLERGMGIQIPEHDYWYDPVSGAVGGIGGPAVGFFPAGLKLGGPLRADASGGGSGMVTGVFVNGRELHVQDLIGLSAITGPILPGRYWLDGNGNYGVEGGGLAGNLLLIARARQTEWAGGGGAGGGSEAWTRYKDYGGVGGATNFGSFGNGDFYFSSGGVDWWPGK